MSVSVSVDGIINVTEGKFKDMLELKASCDKLEVEYPEKMIKFFKESGWEDWEEIGKIKGGKIEISMHNFMKSDNSYGYTIELSKLPKEVKTLRVYMS